MTPEGLYGSILNMNKKSTSTREHQRNMLRKVFFSDVEEFRRRVVDDYVLVNYYNKAYKKWTVAVYKAENYLHQFNEEEAKELNLEEVKIVSTGVINLHDIAQKSAIS